MASDQSFTSEFDAISEVATKQWAVEHRMFACDAYVLRKDYFLIQGHLVPPSRFEHMEFIIMGLPEITYTLTNVGRTEGGNQR